MQASPAAITYCQRGNSHSNMPIIMVCIQKDCTRKRLCCLSCIDQLHCKHEIISVKKFQNYLNDTLNHNALIKNRDQMLEIIVKTKKQIKNSLQELRQNLSQKIDGILKKLFSHFSVIQETFAQQKFRNVGDQIYSEFNDQKIQQYFKLAKNVQSNLVQSLDSINKAISSTDKLMKEKITAFNKDVEKHNQSMIKIIQQFKITGKSNSKKIQFNPQTKAACLVLSDNNLKAQRGQGTGGYPIAVVNQPFSETLTQVSFTIVQQPANKGIWMGVCVLDIVKNFNFQSCYGIGKGTWAIDQVGQNHQSAYSWSHHDTNYNSAPKVGWQFVIGDVVTIKIDYQKSIVRYIRNNSNIYEQPIKLDLGALYAFAGPTNLNDVISIV